jgi:elongation factor P hydroxylase
MHHYQDLITLFNTCYLKKYNTALVKGEDEPLYLPANENLKHHTIYFAHGYFASALHECAHWLIAGEKRRQLVDFGYWYEPDGRTTEQQELFQSVEIKPQAMEWILSSAANFRFRVSIDNLNGSESNTAQFKQAVYNQVKTYCEQGVSERAEIFRRALCQYYGTPASLLFENFDLNTL